METALKITIVTGLMIFTATTSWVLAKESQTNYREIPPDLLTLIEASDKAFMEQNIDAIAEHMSEDFEWHIVNAEGEKLMVSGRAETLQRIERFFTMDTGWTNADVHRLGYLGNIFVQIEVDYYDTPDGRKTVPTLSVYEMKNSQRWREWKFYPAE